MVSLDCQIASGSLFDTLLPFTLVLCTEFVFNIPHLSLPELRGEPLTAKYFCQLE